MNKRMLRRAVVCILLGCSGWTAPPSAIAQRDTIRTQVDLVVVPASVRDSDGKFVYDLKQEDFSIMEDGRRQQIQQFSIDPAPLSVAVLVDTGIGKSALQRFANSIVSIGSALTDSDEAAVYRFDNVVARISDFSDNRENIEKSLAVFQQLAEGRNDRSSNPLLILPGRGPRWLRWLLDLGASTRVLHDAMFTAASDLAARPPEKRKVVVVISDGQVAGSNVHSLREAQERLISGQVQTYGVTVGMALLEGSTSIVHQYADATGGDVYRARTQNAMDSALSRITEQARHQYVLSYISNNEVAGLLPVRRSIEVLGRRQGLNVSHRKSYLQYPLAR